MARAKSIRFQMKSRLGAMEYYGHSKHADQERTWQERQQLRQQGATQAEVQAVDYTKDHIYSKCTMKTYQNEVKRFGDWLEARGLNKCTMEEAKSHVQEYLDHQTERGLSAYSVHTSCAALSKVFGTTMHDYNIPKRELCNITRSRGSHERDTLNNRRAGDVLQANRTLALRRSELKNLRVSNFTDNGTSITMNTVGKGGKANETVFRHPEELAVIRGLLADKAENDYVFSRDSFKNDADFHQSRAEGFQLRYERIVAEMKARPEARAEYQQIIRDTFASRGRECKEDLSRPYVCRGSHRASLIDQGIPVSYDRTAVMMVSLESHYRSDVLVQHYLAK